MARLRQIPQEQWASYLDRFTRRFLGDSIPETADFEVISADLGDQVEGEGVRLHAIDYDPRTDAVEFFYADGVHRVREPQELWVEEDDDTGFVSVMDIAAGDGSREIVRLKPMGVLPPGRGG